MDEFEVIWNRYSLMVYRFLLALSADAELAEELTSETFYRAYLNIGKFRGDCKIETWLCQIAKNAYYKEQKRLGKNQPIDGVENAVYADDMFSRLADKETALALHRHLHNLAEPYKEVFTLRVFGELRFKEIADIFGKSESWAKVTYYRAKDKLVKAMEDEK